MSKSGIPWGKPLNTVLIPLFNSNSKLGCKIFLFLGNDDCISNIAKSYSSLEEYDILLNSFSISDVSSI